MSDTVGRVLRRRKKAERIREWRRERILQRAPGIITRLPRRHYRDDPRAYAHDILGVRRLSEDQEEMLAALGREPQIAAKSGQKTGKTFVFAGIGPWWWEDTRELGRSLLTSSSGPQVKDTLWREVTAAWLLARANGHDLGPAPAQQPSTGVRFTDGRDIIGRTTDQPEKIAGFSGAQIYVLIDEASGFRTDLYESIYGNLRGTSRDNRRLIALSQPTRPAGWFHGAFHKYRRRWFLFTFSSRNTPNYKAGETVIPGMAEREAVDELIETYGEGHPMVLVRVDGLYPTGGDNDVVSLSRLEKALGRWSAALVGDGPLVLGVDVARGGTDDSAIAPRRGLKMYELTTIHGYDAWEVAEAVVGVVRALRRSPQERATAYIDIDGLGGGVLDVLAHHNEWSREVAAIGVRGSHNARDPDKYNSRRSELWWGVRDWIDDGGALPPNDLLEEELVAPIYKVDSRGRIEVQDKDALRKKLEGRSPDRADAVCLAVTGTAAVTTAGTSVEQRSEAKALTDIY